MRSALAIAILVLPSAVSARGGHGCGHAGGHAGGGARGHSGSSGGHGGGAHVVPIEPRWSLPTESPVVVYHGTPEPPFEPYFSRMVAPRVERAPRRAISTRPIHARFEHGVWRIGQD